MALASDAESSASAYANYRCAALIQLNRMTDADTVICDVLDAPNDFDLVSWEAENPSASAELHRQVFTEFFWLISSLGEGSYDVPYIQEQARLQ